MNRYLVVIVIVVVWGVTAMAKEWEVGPTRAVTSLSQAIEMANPQDTICVNPGDYKLSHTLVLKKAVHLIACGEVRLHAPDKAGIFEVRADSVSISGFTLLNVPKSYTKDLAAIWVDYAQHFELRDNHIKDCFFGIFCTKSQNGKITGNQIYGNAKEEHSSANAIHLWHCDSVQISTNQVEHHRDGIYLEFTDNSVIDQNLSRNNLRYGLHFMFSNNDLYHNNTFSKNGAGVAVMFSDHIKMTGNHFLENWGRASYGLLLKEIYDSQIKGNTFEKNTTGIFSEGSSRIAFEANHFKANGWAIRMRGSSMDNEISFNNFVSNSFDIATDAKKDHNRYYNNYWDSYEGYDLNRDGLGDVPHRPVNLFSYLVSRIDESIILLKSSFIEVLNFAEKVAPAVTPTNLVDEEPLMKPML